MSYITVICMSILLACFFVFVISLLQTSEPTSLDEQARLLREQEEARRQRLIQKQQKRQEQQERKEKGS